MEADFQKFLKIAHDFLGNDNSWHDYYHAERVFHLAMKIQEKEGWNPYVIGVSAIMHDLMRPWQTLTGKSHFWEEALGKISSVLVTGWVRQEFLEEILYVIARHDIYDWSQPVNKSVELQIVQDADNIDAIGAIGIARTWKYSWAHNVPMWVPGENLDFSHDYQETGKNTSIIRHFYEKLLKLAERMNTSTARSIAEERNRFMKIYLEQFFSEWSNNK